MLNPPSSSTPSTLSPTTHYPSDVTPVPSCPQSVLNNRDLAPDHTTPTRHHSPVPDRVCNDRGLTTPGKKRSPAYIGTSLSDGDRR